MRKNILTIIILAATLVNLTLTAMIIFTFLPYVKNANNLVNKVVQALDLDLESPNKEDLPPEWNVEDLETTIIMEEQLANLQLGADGKTHYAKVTATLSADSKHDDYKDKSPSIEKNITVIKDYIMLEVNKYSNDDCVANKEEIEKAVLAKVQEFFGSNFIVKITINILIQ